ncbi:hypothetical protein ES703_93269 [subsurface metagenome]
MPFAVYAHGNERIAYRPAKIARSSLFPSSFMRGYGIAEQHITLLDRLKVSAEVTVQNKRVHIALLKFARLDKLTPEIGRRYAVMRLRNITRPQPAELQKVRFDGRQCYANLSIGDIRPVLHRVVVRVRPGKLVAQGLNDRVGTFESEIRIVYLKRKGKINLQKRRGILQDPIGEIDSLNIIIQYNLLRQLRAAGAFTGHYQTSKDRACLSLLNLRFLWTFFFAGLYPSCYELIQLVRRGLIDELSRKFLVVDAFYGAGLWIEYNLEEPVFQAPFTNRNTA